MNQTPSPLQKEMIDRSVIVVFVRGVAEGSGAASFAYVAIPANRAVEFAEALKTPPCHLHEWGRILASGEGEPDDAIRMHMEAVYGVQHEAASPF